MFLALIFLHRIMLLLRFWVMPTLSKRHTSVPSALGRRSCGLPPPRRSQRLFFWGNPSQSGLSWGRGSGKRRK